MMKFKKIGALVLSSILALNMVGCGNNDKKTTGKQGGTIYVTAFKGGYGTEWLEAVADKYTEATGTIVDINWDTNLMTSASDKFAVNANMDDLYYLNLAGESSVQVWYQQGKLESLTEIFNEKGEDGKTLQEKLTKKESGTINGERYYAPLGIAADCLAYNTDILKQVGWDHIPDTVDELVAYFEDVMKANLKADDGNIIKPLVWTGYYDGISHFYEPILAQYGGVEEWNAFYNWSDEKGPSYELYHRDAQLKALEATQRLLKPNANGVSEYSLEGCLGFSNVDAQRAFASGYAAVCITGTWYASEMGSVADNINYKLAGFPLYCDEQGSYGSTMEKIDENGPDAPSNYKKYNIIPYHSDCMVIPTQAKNKEGAKDFLKFMLQEENLKLMHEKRENAFCYEYDTSDLKLSEYGQSVSELINNSVQVIKGANNPLYFSGAIMNLSRPGMWTSIATDKDYDLKKEVVDWCWKNVNDSWEKNVELSKSTK